MFYNKMVFNENLKYRMYVLVERHLSPLDKGIQSAHAVVEYYNECHLWNKKEELKAFDKWANEDKTLILLNGGTVIGLDKTLELFEENNIAYGAFREPDLDNIVTAVAVMADERIFDDNYMSFDMWRLKALLNNAYSSCEKEYEKYIGGHGNVILKEFLNGKKLAR